MEYYHQIKASVPGMKNMEEKEERHDLVKKLSRSRDRRNMRNNSTPTEG